MAALATTSASTTHVRAREEERRAPIDMIQGGTGTWRGAAAVGNRGVEVGLSRAGVGCRVILEVQARADNVTDKGLQKVEGGDASWVRAFMCSTAARLAGMAAPSAAALVFTETGACPRQKLPIELTRQRRGFGVPDPLSFIAQERDQNSQRIASLSVSNQPTKSGQAARSHSMAGTICGALF